MRPQGFPQRKDNRKNPWSYPTKHGRAAEKTRAAREMDPTEFDGIAEIIEADVALAEEDPALVMPRKAAGR